MLLTIIYYVNDAMTDGNATYDNAVCVIAAVEIDYNIAVLV